MPTMNVNLSDDLQAFVAQQLEQGGYTNQSEVVREGLRLLRERHEKLQHLRAAVDVGLAAADRAESQPLTDDLLDAIAERARKNVIAKRATRA